MKTARPIWPVLLAVILGVVGLLSLGAWQLQRLQWKEGLLTQLANNLSGDPVDLATAESLSSGGGNIEFLKVRIRAKFDHAAQKNMITTFDGGPAWTIITPAITSDGRGVLIDRGQAPVQQLETIDRPVGEVEITGVVRLYRNGKGYFDPENDRVRNGWYWWDLPAMLKDSNFPADVMLEPFVVQILPGSDLTGFPRPAEPKANLRNNHLVYAVTWFSLALVLVVMGFLYIRGLAKKSIA